MHAREPRARATRQASPRLPEGGIYIFERYRIVNMRYIGTPYLAHDHHARYRNDIEVPVLPYVGTQNYARYRTCIAFGPRITSRCCLRPHPPPCAPVSEKAARRGRLTSAASERHRPWALTASAANSACTWNVDWVPKSLSSGSAHDTPDSTLARHRAIAVRVLSLDLVSARARAEPGLARAPRKAHRGLCPFKSSCPAGWPSTGRPLSPTTKHKPRAGGNHTGITRGKPHRNRRRKPHRNRRGKTPQESQGESPQESQGENPQESQGEPPQESEVGNPQ